jgi:hypothetical protein
MTLIVHVSGESYSFVGPFTDTEDLGKKSGVYVVTTKQPDGIHKILDVGESEDIRNCIEYHDRKACWKRHMQNGIYVSGYYCKESERMRIETAVRSAQNPPCGDR